METYTFIDKLKEFTFTVKSEFLQNCPNPETKTSYELFDDHAIYNFFHNPEGPAMVNLKNGAEEFFINGKYVKEGEERERIKYGKNFKEGFDQALKS